MAGQAKKLSEKYRYHSRPGEGIKNGPNRVTKQFSFRVD